MIHNLMGAMILAAATAMDGPLPLYPHAVPTAAFHNVPAKELAQGTAYLETSSDPVQTVDQWYTANAPKSCTRKDVHGVANDGRVVNAVVYTCANRDRIYLQKYGSGTLIGFVFP